MGRSRRVCARNGPCHNAVRRADCVQIASDFHPLQTLPSWVSLPDEDRTKPRSL
jgi:hypothetical protein